MDPRTLNIIGLVLNVAGVLVLFKYNFPQPTFEDGVGLGLEDGTVLDDGRTIVEHDQQTRCIKARYLMLSRVALLLILVGFACRLIAAVKS